MIPPVSQRGACLDGRNTDVTQLGAFTSLTELAWGAAFKTIPNTAPIVRTQNHPVYTDSAVHGTIDKEHFLTL